MRNEPAQGTFEDERDFHFSGAGSEMARLIKDLDWAAAGLCAFEDWPPSLRTAVDLMLGQPLPMRLYWGPRFISIYNDAFRPLLGPGHPAALGAPAGEPAGRGPELPRAFIEAPLQGGRPVRLEGLEVAVANGKATETAWYSVSLGPISGESGIGGVLAVFQDISATVVAARRSAALRELSRLPPARPAADICRDVVETLVRREPETAFAFLYLVEREGGTLKLAAAAGAVPELSAFEFASDDEGLPGGVGVIGQSRPHGTAPPPHPELLQWPHLIGDGNALAVPVGRPSVGYLVYGCKIRASDEGRRDFLESAASRIALRLQDLESASAPPASQALAAADSRAPDLLSCQDLVARLPVGLWCWRFAPDGSLLPPLASAGLRDLCGLPPAAGPGDAPPILALVHPEDRNRLEATAREAALTLRPWQADFRLLHPERGELHLEMDARPAAEAGGSVCLYVSVHDATERKRAAAGLRRAHERLALAQKSAGIGIWEWDFRTGALNGSRELFALLGLRPDEKLSGRRAWHRAVHPDDLPRVNAGIRSALKEGRPLNIEFRARLDSGGVRWLQAVGDILPGADGDPLCMTGICLDIGSRKEAEEALREADRRKDKFLAVLAHELRNPLAPIRNAAKILRRAGNDSALQERAHAMLERQILHMVRLVDDLLDVSRISRGKFELRREPVDLAVVLEDALATSRPLIDQAGLEVDFDLPDEGWVLNADATRLAQVFANLLNNAAKFSLPGGRIRVSACREGDRLEVSISDNGVGVAPAMLPWIFDMFVQSEPSAGKSRSGLGIGLNLAREIVLLHEGSIEAYSSGEGKGSEFVVRLPLLAENGRPEGDSGVAGPRYSLADPGPGGTDGIAETAAEWRVEAPRPDPSSGGGSWAQNSIGEAPALPDSSHWEEPPAAAAAAPATQGGAEPDRHSLGRVLVVDDNEDAATSLAELVEILGFEARVGYDGLDAVALAETFRPDLILLDIGMPRMNGLDACRLIRGQPWSAGIQVAALTGWGLEDDIRRSREAGFDRHLVKPVEPEALEELLKEVAGKPPRA